METNEQQTNPANLTQSASPAAERKATPRRKRIPMSTPNRKLEVPPIDGFYLYWFRDDEVMRAIAAGYEHVKDSEVELIQMDVAGAEGVSGNTDLGSNVTFVGGKDDNGHPQRAVLMKLPMEFFLEDQREMAIKNTNLLQSIFQGEQVLTEEGLQNLSGLTYVKDKNTSATDRAGKPLFNRPVRKARR